MVSLGVLVGVPVLTGYAQWWEILAILVGLVLLAMEIFVIPGFGVTGISGVLLICGGLVMTFVGDEPVEIPGVLPSLKGTWDAIFRGMVIVVTGMGCSLLLWLWIQRYLPKLPYVNKLILMTPQGAVEAVDQPTAAPWPVLGSIGTAVTDLRPSGTAEFADETIGDVRSAEVVSDSGFVRAGARVVVCKVRGARVVVKTV
jgi:membrane-bound serine protease (ClpP class)